MLAHPPGNGNGYPVAGQMQGGKLAFGQDIVVAKPHEARRLAKAKVAGAHLPPFNENQELPRGPTARRAQTARHAVKPDLGSLLGPFDTGSGPAKQGPYLASGR